MKNTRILSAISILGVMFSVLLLHTEVKAQCNFHSTAIAGPTLLTVSGTGNRSGVAWNPDDSLYYSVNAGSGSYPIETYSRGGGSSVASVSAGISFRGLWWNMGLSQLEGNGHGTTGLRKQNIDAVTGHALGTGTSICSGQNQPTTQSCGDLDFHANEVIYYSNGSIYRYDRATCVAIGNYALNSNPGNLADITTNGVIYTGCAGNEIGIYDYVNRKIYLFDKATGNYATTILLPATAPQPAAFGFSFANDLAWVFDGIARVWHSYEIFAPCVPPTAVATPQSATTFCVGDSVVFTAPTGSGFTYQWQMNGADLVGDTTDSYTATMSGDYRVYVAITGCGDTSSAVTVTVNSLPTATAVAGGPTTFCEGDSVVLTGSGGTTYQWLQGGSNISGATNAAYTAFSSGLYSVMVTDNNSCSNTSGTISVVKNANPAPAITQNLDTLSTGQSFTTYQWNLNGSPIGGATSYFYIAPAAGVYSVTVSFSNGCEGTSDTLNYVPVGIADGQIPGMIKVYPNPASSQINLLIQNELSGSGEVRIINVLGATLWNTEIQKQDAAFKLGVDITQLPGGMYWLEIQLADRRRVMRFVKD